MGNSCCSHDSLRDEFWEEDSKSNIIPKKKNKISISSGISIPDPQPLQKSIPNLQDSVDLKQLSVDTSTAINQSMSLRSVSSLLNEQHDISTAIADPILIRKQATAKRV